MSRFNSFFAFLGVAFLFSGSVARASVERTPLLQDAEVNGKSIYLSDLLPESSPAAIRSEAQQILIGRSPQPGGTRVLSSDDIVRLLSGLNLLPQVRVPEQIVVHRAGYLITRDEVANAIEKTMNSNGESRPSQVAPESVRLAAHVFVSVQDPDLRVTRVESDRTLHGTKYWLVSRADPTLQPFMATISAVCDACRPDEKLQVDGKTQSSTDMAKSLSNVIAARQASAPPTLIEAGKAARLHLFSESGTQMYLIAIPLERGTMGQDVRVKIKETGKILTARVTGHQQLEAEY